MADARQNSNERRLSHVRALKEQFFSEHETKSDDVGSELRDRDAKLEARAVELNLAMQRVHVLEAQLQTREAELAEREGLIADLENELDQLRLRLGRRMPIAETLAPPTKRRPADDAPRFDFYSGD